MFRLTADNIASIGLIITVGPVSGVADHLNVCVGQPTLWFTGAKQRTGDGEPFNSIVVVRQNAKLAQGVV